MPRVEFFARCAALEDLAYGRATGRREYVTNAERSFEWLFRADRKPRRANESERRRRATARLGGSVDVRGGDG
jgi:hypothetical protein